MGYELHIVRVKNVDEGETATIKAEEWRALVAQDPEMRIVEGNHAEWLAHPDEIVSFELQAGEISFKHPDDPTLAKMIQIAKRLGAQVRGDEDEIYDRVDKQVSDEKREKRKRKELTLAQKEAHSYGVYFPAFEVAGFHLKRVSIAVYTDSQHQSHFAIRRSRKTLIAPLDGQQSARRLVLLFILPLGFRLTTRDGQKFTMIVSQSKNWIRYLRQPKTKVSFQLQGIRWKWIWS